MAKKPRGFGSGTNLGVYNDKPTVQKNGNYRLSCVTARQVGLIPGSKIPVTITVSDDDDQQIGSPVNTIATASLQYRHPGTVPGQRIKVKVTFVQQVQEGK